MPIQPLDLQTLFARMNQIGRDQAHLRNAEVHAQETVGKEIQQRTALKQHSVQETDEIQDGPEKVHDDDESQQNKHQQDERKKQQDEEHTQAEGQLRDPALGNNFDLSG